MLKLEKIDTRKINGKDTPVRIYRNTMTESEVTTYLLYTDKQKNSWWTFEDLFALPFIRQLAAKKVLDLYGHGLALEDVKTITSQMKSLLKSDSPERYEKTYAKVLELENLTETMADPVKQCIGLCTVYLLLNDEQPDVWTNHWSAQKMTLLSLDIASQAFFLSWWTGIMRLSGSVLKGLSQIASTVVQSSESEVVEP
jgi:hypothetical protein